MIARLSYYKIFYLTALITTCYSCDSVILRRPQSGQALETAGGAEIISTLKAPIDNASQIRILFFVDQSYSMIYGKCPTDLDGIRPNSASSGCPKSSSEKGIDPEGIRFTVIQTWLDQLKQSNRQDIKVALFPFSGGSYSRPREYPYNHTEIPDGFEHYRFMSLQAAETRLLDLIKEHESDLNRGTEIDEKDFVGSTPIYMGTTAPYKTLEFARDQMMKEMELLRKAGQLQTSQFRFIYLSDGIFKPTEPILKNALKLAGSKCNIKCVLDPRYVTCDREKISVLSKEWASLTTEEKAKLPKECAQPDQSGSVDSCYCVNIGNDFYETFGDPALNASDKLVEIVTQIKNLPKYFGEGRVKFDFVRINSDRVSEPDNENIYGKMQKAVGDSTLSELNDTTPPFSLNVSSAAQLTYQLVDFYAVNINAFYSEDGQLVSDSDGDGLSDLEEIKLGTDPLNPRTPDANGKSWCLDSIEKKYGCKKTSCDPLLDSDGDGLNECEELTLQTDPYQKENGFDHIIDYFKNTRGLSLSTDLRQQDSNGDGTADYTAFKFGIHPMVPFSLVPEELKTKVTVEFNGYVDVKNPDGSTARLAQNKIKINQIPLVSTLKTTVGSQLYSSKIHTESTRIKESNLIGATPHAVNENEILFIGKVQAIQSPLNSYYIFLRKKIKATGAHIQLNIDFNDFTQLPGQ